MISANFSPKFPMGVFGFKWKSALLFKNHTHSKRTTDTLAAIIPNREVRYDRFQMVVYNTTNVE